MNCSQSTCNVCCQLVTHSLPQQSAMRARCMMHNQRPNVRQRQRQNPEYLECDFLCYSILQYFLLLLFLFLLSYNVMILLQIQWHVIIGMQLFLLDLQARQCPTPVAEQSVDNSNKIRCAIAGSTCTDTSAIGIFGSKFTCVHCSWFMFH